MWSAIAKVFGITFLFLGVLGFVPGAKPGGYLFGVFDVNTVRNFFYLLTAIAALASGHSGAHACKRFFFVAGVVYIVIAILGFIMLDRPLLGIFANDLASAWFHFAVASICIAFALLPEATPQARRNQEAS